MPDPNPSPQSPEYDPGNTPAPELDPSSTPEEMPDPTQQPAGRPQDVGSLLKPDVKTRRTAYLMRSARTP